VCDRRRRSRILARDQRVPSVYPSRLLLEGERWAVGGRAAAFHPVRTLIASRMLPRTVSPNTRLAGGQGGTGREGNPVTIDVGIAAAAADRRLCCPAGVPMMEAADHGRRDDAAPIGTLHRSGLRGVLAEGQVSPGLVVVREIGAQHAAQVGVVQ